MRTCFALLCVVLLFALAFFHAYFEAERLLSWPEPVYRCFDLLLPLVAILMTALLLVGLPWIVGCFQDDD